MENWVAEREKWGKGFSLPNQKLNVVLSHLSRFLKSDFLPPLRQSLALQKKIFFKLGNLKQKLEIWEEHERIFIV